MTTTLENDVFAVPEPGEPMTVETIAHDLRVARWTVARAFNALRHNGDAFRNRNAQSQISADKRRPARQATR
ncbi:hypothetical protein IU443_24460 [Nocardia farcinica]|uniref:hypothetical protein n=1 Tax=Nocardia TaxID=1817 RepID=UPI000A395931|nr:MULTISPECIES: hypothetical protein [Nocardia]UAK33298.1 hypothetical protein K8O92_04735 [Nocardia asteroides]MBF6072786.1 hypothetical protein [Nocardia farcinica]MBF6234588.1 hypothetical protein [Nocardia farcinica]MBF6253830.1 hypothetical protein [Nocardia farcinica]MBF6265359.1 hypothetical protein [Nocardia farcinica]